jgi:hypothetical protein
MESLFLDKSMQRFRLILAVHARHHAAVLTDSSAWPDAADPATWLSSIASCYDSSRVAVGEQHITGHGHPVTN